MVMDPQGKHEGNNNTNYVEGDTKQEEERREREKDNSKEERERNDGEDDIPFSLSPQIMSADNLAKISCIRKKREVKEEVEGKDVKY